MSSDPSINVVVFKIQRQGKEEVIVNEVRTQALDGFKMAWAKAQQSHNVEAKEVHEIYSEWEPTEDDLAFVDQYLPHARASYSFDRPTDGNWTQAFATVQQAIEAAHLEEARKHGESAVLHPETTVLLPILRNADAMTQTLVHEPFFSKLALCLAYVKTTAEGRIGIEYVMTGAFQNSDYKKQAMWQEAYETLARGLNVSAAEHEGDQFFVLSREGGFAASALGFGNFFDNASSWVKSERLLIAVLNPDTLAVCAADRPVASYLQERVRSSTYNGAVDLKPCLLMREPPPSA